MLLFFLCFKYAPRFRIMLNGSFVIYYLQLNENTPRKMYCKNKDIVFEMVLKTNFLCFQEMKEVDRWIDNICLWNKENSSLALFRRRMSLFLQYIFLGVCKTGSLWIMLLTMRSCNSRSAWVLDELNGALILINTYR